MSACVVFRPKYGFVLFCVDLDCSNLFCSYKAWICLSSSLSAASSSGAIWGSSNGVVLFANGTVVFGYGGMDIVGYSAGT